uniref:Fibrinogen C-terminal domain-containing protein n=1 Tax=Neogobius melanostomus TaxID=47308 RepID=A0A8C6U4T2_9GOBI
MLIVPCQISCDEHKTLPSVETRSRFAALDEVSLLATGLLQLGQSLREFVQKTKGQINDIVQKLNIFDRSFYQLSALASEIKVEEEELKKTTVGLKASNEEIKDLSIQINTKVDSILQEKSRLQNKVEGLEERLSSMSQALVTSEQVEEITALKVTIFTSEYALLLKAVKEQRIQLNQQSSKIKMLENKLATNMQQQETIEKLPDISSTEVPSLPPFQFSESVNGSKLMNLPLDCSELFNRGERISGVYAIKPNTSEPFMAFCDMRTGETVIQRRTDGSINFDQNWEKYESGFGDLQGEFWLGLKRVHSLSAQGTSILHIQLEEWKQPRRSIEHRFELEGPQTNYTIHLTPLSGDLQDFMSNNTGMSFSTKDRDSGNQPHHNCIQDTGGWWLNAFAATNLNGKYLRPKGRLERKKGIQCGRGRKGLCFLKLTQISVRPLSSAVPIRT